MKILTNKSSPPSEIEQKVSAKQTQMLYQNLPLNTVFHLSMSFLLCAILWVRSDRRSLLVWWACIAVLSIVRIVGFLYFRQNVERHTTRYWNIAFGMGSFAIGLLWGSAGAFLTPHAVLSYELFVGFLIAGMVVGAIPVLSLVKEVYYSFVIAAETPYIIHILNLSGDIYTAVAVIHCAFVILVLLMSSRTHKLIGESLQLRFYNDDLVKKLQGSNELLQGEVTSHKQTESQLRENEQRLSALVGASFEGIVLHRAGTILEANRGISEMTGYTVEELLGTEVGSLLAESSRNEVLEKINLLIGFPIEAIVRRKDGGGFPVEIRTGYAPYGGENVAFVVVRDITYYKELLKTQAVARQKAEEADKAKTEFLAAVSHELRTPLNAVMGFTQLLQDTSLTDEQKEYLSMTYQSGEQLLRLINDLLDLSRIESGRFDLEIVNVELREELNHVLNLMSLKLQESGNIIRTDFSSDLLATVDTDPLRLRQVLINLLGNAIKFTENGEIVFRAFVEKACLSFVIQDTGMGIPQDKLEYIFGKFNQIDSSISRQHGGAGLGLAISKRLVEAMQGSISVTSIPGKGTTFRVDLPLSGEHMPVEKVAPDNIVYESVEDDSTGEGMNILLVEDDQTNQMIAVAILRKFGYSIMVAENGQQALELCQQKNNFQLIFMDIQMPVMDGITATQRLRENGISIPIVAMTANAMTGDRETYLQAGMNDYISKPIIKADLLRLLEQYQK